MSLAGYIVCWLETYPSLAARAWCVAATPLSLCFLEFEEAQDDYKTSEDRLRAGDRGLCCLTSNRTAGWRISSSERPASAVSITTPAAKVKGLHALRGLLQFGSPGLRSRRRVHAAVSSLELDIMELLRRRVGRNAASSGDEHGGRGGTPELHCTGREVDCSSGSRDRSLLRSAGRGARPVDRWRRPPLRFTRRALQELGAEAPRVVAAVAARRWTVCTYLRR